MIRDLQTLFTYQAIKMAFPTASEQAVKDYYQKTRVISTILTESAPSSGTGSPEGVVSANLSQLYIDTAVPRQYWNPNYGAKTGWVAL